MEDLQRIEAFILVARPPVDPEGERRPVMTKLTGALDGGLLPLFVSRGDALTYLDIAKGKRGPINGFEGEWDGSTDVQAVRAEIVIRTNRRG